MTDELDGTPGVSAGTFCAGSEERMPRRQEEGRERRKDNRLPVRLRG